MDFLSQYPVRVHEVRNRENTELGVEKHALKGRHVTVVAWEGIPSGKCFKENKKTNDNLKIAFMTYLKEKEWRPSAELQVCSPSA